MDKITLQLTQDAYPTGDRNTYEASANVDFTIAFMA